MLHLHTGLGQFHTPNKHLSKPVQTKSVFIQLEESNRTEPGGCSRNVSSSLAVRNAAVSGACSEPPLGTSRADILTKCFAELGMFDSDGFQPLQQLCRGHLPH